jgi:hypothetical protein
MHFEGRIETNMARESLELVASLARRPGRAIRRKNVAYSTNN